jgi:hypothetical protein
MKFKHNDAESQWPGLRKVGSIFRRIMPDFTGDSRGFE